MERGIRTSEFWLSAIGALVAVIVPLLVAYGVLDNDKGEMWAALILALASIVVPIVVGSVVKNYNDNRTAVKTEAIGLERDTAQLEMTRLESMGNES